MAISPRLISLPLNDKKLTLSSSKGSKSRARLSHGLCSGDKLSVKRHRSQISSFWSELAKLFHVFLRAVMQNFGCGYSISGFFRGYQVACFGQVVNLCSFVMSQLHRFLGLLFLGYVGKSLNDVLRFIAVCNRVKCRISLVRCFVPSKAAPNSA